MRGASGVAMAGTIDQLDPLPNWLQSPERMVKLMQTCNEEALPEESSLRSRLSMFWTIGHLLHGSGFSEQALAAAKPKLSALPFYLHKTVCGCLCEIMSSDYATGQPERTKRDESQSTSQPQSGREWCSLTSLSWKTVEKLALFGARYSPKTP